MVTKPKTVNPSGLAVFLWGRTRLQLVGKLAKPRLAPWQTHGGRVWCGLVSWCDRDLDGWYALLSPFDDRRLNEQRGEPWRGVRRTVIFLETLDGERIFSLR